MESNNENSLYMSRIVTLLVQIYDSQITVYKSIFTALKSESTTSSVSESSNYTITIFKARFLPTSCTPTAFVIEKSYFFHTLLDGLDLLYYVFTM